MAWLCRVARLAPSVRLDARCIHASASESYQKVAMIGANIMADMFIARLGDGPSPYEKHISNRAGDEAFFANSDVVIFDGDQEQATALADRYGCRSSSDVHEAVHEADMLFFFLKPQSVPSLVHELKGSVSPSTIVATTMLGTTMAQVAEGLGIDKVIRTMPNDSSGIGLGVTVWCTTPGISKEEHTVFARLLQQLGTDIFVNDEKFLDVAAAVSAASPAYVYLAMESLTDAAVQMGLPRRTALAMVQNTFYGTAANARQSGDHLAAQRNNITSPGGASAAALYVLEKGGFRTTLHDGAFAAHDTSIQLGAIGQGELPDGYASNLPDSSY